MSALNPKGAWRGLWNDDSQVVSLTVERVIDRINPRTVVVVEVVESGEQAA